MSIYKSMKVCGKCDIEKETCEFTFRKDTQRFESQCKSCIKEYLKKYYKNNSLKIIENNKKSYYENRDEKLEYVKTYRKENRDNRNKYEKLKRNTDPVYKLKINVRNRISKYLKKNNINKTDSTFILIGISPIKLKVYLEEQFTKGMSWDNYGEWHIDHKIPLSFAKNEEDIAKLCHYINLQPLWAEDNLKKSNKIIN
jgi:hypothetical protein